MQLPSNDHHILFCPRCSGRRIRWRSPKNFECEGCGFTLFLNVASAVAVIIECDGKILFGIRKNDPGRGMLDLPGGFANPGESAEECARREVREETGLVIRDMTYLLSRPNTYVYKDVLYDTLDIVFTAALDRMPQVTAGDDLAEVVWLERETVNIDEMAFSSLRAAVRQYLQGESS